MEKVPQATNKASAAPTVPPRASAVSTAAEEPAGGVASKFVDAVKVSAGKQVGAAFIDVIMQIITVILGLCPAQDKAKRATAFVRLAKQPVAGLFARARLRRAAVEVLAKNGQGNADPTPYVATILDVGDTDETSVQEFLDENDKAEFEWGV